MQDRGGKNPNHSKRGNDFSHRGRNDSYKNRESSETHRDHGEGSYQNRAATQGNNNDRGRGGSSDRGGRGNFSNDRGRGGSSDRGGRGHFSNDRGGRGNYSNDRGRGESTDRGGRGHFSNDRGRGGSSDRGGRGHFSNDRGRGESTDRGGRGHFSNDRGGRGNYSNDRGGRGNYSNDRGGRGNYSNDRGGRGNYSNQVRSNLTIDTKDYVTEINPSEIAPNEKVATLGEYYGKEGKPISIVGNYFKITSLPNTNFSQYSVQFEPEVENDRMKRFLISRIVSEYSQAFIFDGQSLFLPIKIDENLLNKTLEVTAKQPQLDGNKDKIEKVKTDIENMSINKNMIKLTFKFVSAVSNTSPVLTMIYNLVIRKIFKSMKFKIIKRQYYDSNEKFVLDDLNLEIWPGFSMNISSFSNHIFICADVCHHVLSRTTVLDRLYSLYNPQDKNYIEVVNKDLLGQVVMTRYNGLTYRIDSIDFKRTVSDKFVLRSGQEISYIEYYRENYGIKIQDPKQPLLVSLPRKKDIKANMKGGSSSKKIEDEIKPVHLIPELCLMTGITADMRSNFSIMKSIADRTRVNPTERSQQLVNFIKKIKNNEEAYSHLKDWKIDIEPKLVSVPGRNLNPEPIITANGQLSYSGSEWTSKLRDMKLLSTPSLQNWLLIFSNRNKSMAMNFCESLISISGKVGFSVSRPILIEIPNTNANTLRTAIKTNYNSTIKLIVNIIDSNKKDSYDSIKIMCYKELGVASQVVLAKTLLKQQSYASVVNKIAIQISCKLGGEPWSVSIPMKNYMIIGIDVCHDPSLLKNSYGGFVATLNTNYTRYFSRVSINLKGMEMMDSLGKCLSEALVAYRNFNNCMPRGIIVYRDGVGDGQIDLHVELELKSMNQVLDQIQMGPDDVKPTLACLVVKKRISSRLFSINDSNFSNPPAGTIVDQVFNRKKYPNFYLISQYVNQGCVVPTHYVVTQNSTNLTTDHLQRLTYKLCHTYFNWSGVIRVPSPVQYAHKLCYIASNSIRDECNRNLEQQLFYL